MADSNTIKVWDLGVRLFHWSLVAAFATAYLSKTMHDLHTWAGYTLIGLLLFRLVWGVVGTRYARFTNFLYGPRAVAAYLRGLLRGHPPHYTGHNPAGGWMIFLMLIHLVLLSFSGLKALGDEGEGPFAHWQLSLFATAHAHGDERHDNTAPRDAAGGDEPVTAGQQTEQSDALPPASAREQLFWSELHADLSNLMLLLIAIHISGVLLSSYLHRENLVRAMITGRKHHKQE
ncbi:MAG TPA: cytochrome b/b6 domain-containing protein [Gammaproteobacteria bacterium]